MLDPEKTNNLRKRLDAIKPGTNATVEYSEQEERSPEDIQKGINGWKALGYLIGKNLAFWGAQYFVLTKAHIAPFVWWESIIVFSGLTAVISQFKKV